MSVWISIAAVGVVVYLCWNLFRRFGADRIAAIGEKRRAGSRLVSRGRFVDGARQVGVSLALTHSTFFYENAETQASLELVWVSEVEYDTRLASGPAVGDGRVLRLRCYEQIFEFVLPNDVVSRWYMMLPPRRAVVTPLPDVPRLVPTVSA